MLIVKEEYWEEFYCVHYSDNSKQEASVAISLTMLMKKLMFIGKSH